MILSSSSSKVDHCQLLHVGAASAAALEYKGVGGGCQQTWAKLLIIIQEKWRNRFMYRLRLFWEEKTTWADQSGH